MTTLAVDPNYFRLDWDRLGEVLMALIVLSILVERALSILFESQWFIHMEKSRDWHLKEPIALIVSAIVCMVIKFDALTIIIMMEPQMTYFGYVFTGAIIAGGSKASVKLFRDVMKVKSAAQEEVDVTKKVAIEKTKIEAEMNAAEAIDTNANPPSKKKPAPDRK